MRYSGLTGELGVQVWSRHPFGSSDIRSIPIPTNVTTHQTFRVTKVATSGNIQMIRPNQSKSVFRALVSAMALSITLATHASEADEKPKAVIALPADPSTPVIATVKVGGHSYRMLVD